MTDDFDGARRAFHDSVPGRLLAAVINTTQTAWRTSTVRRAVHSASERIGATTTPAIVRNMAVAIMIAAAAQPLLIAAMPPTVAPAMPRAMFALVSIVAAVVAWQADAIVSAWPASRLARLTRR